MVCLTVLYVYVSVFTLYIYVLYNMCVFGSVRTLCVSVCT